MDLSILRGKINFIIGRSGEGKSVTIKHMVGLMKPDNGAIRVDGQRIDQMEGSKLQDNRRKFGLCFQHGALFDSMSVYENVAFPLIEYGLFSRSKCRNRVEEVLKELDMTATKDKYPADLSTGEKKRVALARAMAPHPQILLFDEPTTGMDPLVCEMIDDLIVQVSADPGVTSVVISHDLKAALQTGQNIIMLYKGKVVLAGPPDHFRNSANPVIQQFFGGKIEGPMEFL